MFFTRLIARVLLATITIQAILIPAEATAAVVDIHGVDHTWAHHVSGLVDNWMYVGATLNGGSARAPEFLYIPRDNWAEIADGAWNMANGTDRRMIDGPAWMTAANVSAGLNRQDDTVDYSLRKIPPGGSYSQVFAAYDPVNATARILVQKVEKGMDNRVHVYVADFTPYHGRLWAVARYHMTPEELTNPYIAGHNPFNLFQQYPDLVNGQESYATDPLWHNVSFPAVQVAVGYAMQHYQAAFGMIYIPDTRFDQNQSCSSSFFKKKCTTTVKGYAKPKWFLAVPKNMDSTPVEAVICTHSTATTEGKCLAPEWTAKSGISVRPWTGGNLPVDEEMLYQWQQSKSSLSVMGIGIILGVLTMGMALAYGLPMLGASAGVNAVGATTAATTGAAAVGATVGGAYIAGTTLATGEGANAAQADLLGKVGDGQLMPNLSAMGEQAQGLAAAVAPKMRAGIIGATMTGARRMAYGDCPNTPGARCNAVDPGIAPRTTSYRQRNVPLDLWDSREQCKMAGNMGVALDRCTARMEKLRIEQPQPQ